MINNYQRVFPNVEVRPRVAPIANFGGARCLMPPKPAEIIAHCGQPSPGAAACFRVARGAAKAGVNVLALIACFVSIAAFMAAMKGPVSLGGIAILFWLFR